MKRLREKEVSSLAETKNENISLPSLPEELIIIIVSLLPVKSIKRFRCVCKPWLELFKGHDFINMHLNHAIENNRYNVYLTTVSSYQPSPPYYRLDFDEASVSSLSDKAVKIDLPILCSLPAGTLAVYCRRFLGSCNGIFCFYREILSHSFIVSLWNLSTQEYKDIVYKKPNHEDVVAYGFGYDSKIDSYKLILIFSEQHNYLNSEDYSDKFSEIHVYTLGSNTWKIIGNTNYAVRMHRDMYSMKPLNGAMHWVAKKLIATDKRKQQTVTTVILCFDISEERTKEIQIPSCLLDGRYKFRNERVGVLGKELYFSAHVSDVFELWVMKDYGVVDSWTKLLSIPEKIEKMKLLNAPEEIEGIYIWETLVLCSNNREIIFNCDYRGRHDKNALVSYDLRNGRLTFLNICDTPVMFTAEPFIESLVSVASSK